MKHTLSVLVNNHSGVLRRVAGLFSRRGYNIESLSVGVTQNPEVSRMTIVVLGDDNVIEQIIRQLEKLIDVREVIELDGNLSISRELALIKVPTTPTSRAEIIAIVDIFRARIVDVAHESLTIEITGEQSKFDAFCELMNTYGIEEITRTGVTAIMRGNFK